MPAPVSPPRYLSLNRLAQITGRSRVTLLLRVKDGQLVPDAVLDVGGGRCLPLFRSEQAGPLRQPAPKPVTQPSTHPLL